MQFIHTPKGHILVATGRTPNTDRLDVAKAAVDLDSRGYIQVNEKLQTSAPDVWAMGECAGSPKFTHVGEDDCRVVLDNLAGGSRTTRGRLIPFCLFTDPELARVGMNESNVKAKNVPYRVAQLPMSLVLRTRTLSQTRGFIKALIADDDHILGFTALGAEASELMAVVQTAMLGGMPYTALRDAIFTHPTAAEGLIALFANPPSAPCRNSLCDRSASARPTAMIVPGIRSRSTFLLSPRPGRGQAQAPGSRAADDRLDQVGQEQMQTKSQAGGERGLSGLDDLAAGIRSQDVEPFAPLADGLDRLLDLGVGLVAIDVHEEEVRGVVLAL
jgi:hypothetical protein